MRKIPLAGRQRVNFETEVNSAFFFLLTAAKPTALPLTNTLANPLEAVEACPVIYYGSSSAEKRPDNQPTNPCSSVPPRSQSQNP
ncbi:hypothetical protein CEP53_003115 [Fusarium sp. AF-6]|nr:hypothetical protein CEP53_003115 [Fusarium sp. AF-6]